MRHTITAVISTPAALLYGAPTHPTLACLVDSTTFIFPSTRAHKSGEGQCASSITATQGTLRHLVSPPSYIVLVLLEYVVTTRCNASHLDT